MNEQWVDLHVVRGQRDLVSGKPEGKLKSYMDWYKHNMGGCQEQLTQLLSSLFSVSCAPQLFLCLAWAKYEMTDVSVPAAKRVCSWQLLLNLKLWMMGGLLGGWGGWYRQPCILPTRYECFKKSRTKITLCFWSITGSLLKNSVLVWLDRYRNDEAVKFDAMFDQFRIKRKKIR